MNARWRTLALLFGPPVAFFAVLLVVSSPEGAGVKVVVGNVVYLVPVFLLMQRGRTHVQERGWVTPLALGILAFIVAADLSGVQTATGSSILVGANAVANLCVIPLFLLSVLTAVRNHLGGAGIVVALDGATGALAAATVALGALGPLLTRVWDGSAAGAVALAYAVGDVLLVAAALGALGLVGLRNGRHFTLWAAGMVVFAVGDIRYAYLSAAGAYTWGHWLDAVWAVGCSLMALGALFLRAPRSRRVPGAGSLAVVLASALSGVGVLVVAPVLHHGPIPIALAVVTLLCCGVRFMLAFHQLRELTAVRVLAHTDELTGLANRRALYAELDRRFERSATRATERAEGFALLLVDLDHFKEVNDSFGHAAGDELLQGVAARLMDAAARVGVPHLVARLGGDEFAVLLGETSSGDAASVNASAFAASLTKPMNLSKSQVLLHVRGSIGVAMAPEHARSRGDLLFAADAAMYEAKSSGEPVSLFSPVLAGDRRRRLALAEDLYQALENDELIVEYQPIVATGSGATEVGGFVVAGVEALVRWDHPTHGRLPPDEFLPAAERHRLTSSIAQRVLDVALGDLARWRAAGHSLRLSVNVSASDLGDGRLVDMIDVALAKHDVPPADLTIEVTETAIMRDPSVSRSVMMTIAEMGVGISVDDYGTGYSSLEYLLRLPISEIKLDRAFLADLSTPRSVAIVRSTIDLTHALGLHMVAEGVEDENSLRTLCELGCDLVQGWHVGRPAPVAVLEGRLEMMRSTERARLG